MERSDLVDLVVVLRFETELAVLVSETGERKDAVWLSKSQVEIAERPRREGRTPLFDLTLPERLAEEKGLG
jgi:hypothetical protein